MTPGQRAYQAVTGLTGEEFGAVLEWSELGEDRRAHWERIGVEVYRPVVEQLYAARHATYRLLVAYRSRLYGNWYELTAKDCGISLDALGMLDKAYQSPTPSKEVIDRIIYEIENVNKLNQTSPI